MAQTICFKDELVEQIYDNNSSRDFSVLQKHSNSRPKVIPKIDVMMLHVNNFAKLTEKHM